MEMIKVQTAGSEAYKACEDYLTRFEAEQDPSGPAEIRRYHNAAVECCYAIVLKWPLDHPEVQGSNLAQHLIHDLRHFGMVNHSVWITPNSAKQLTPGEL